MDVVTFPLLSLPPTSAYLGYRAVRTGPDRSNPRIRIRTAQAAGRTVDELDRIDLDQPIDR